MLTQSTTAGCDVSKAWLDVAHGTKIERIDWDWDWDCPGLVDSFGAWLLPRRGVRL